MVGEKQRTLKTAVSISGTGLHTGETATVVIHPAPSNHGYVFKRIDMEGGPTIRSVVDNVSETARGTTLGENGATVNTVEHLLSALFGLGIDNALIEIDGPEVPILDGSAGPFVDAIITAGIEELKEFRNYFVVKQPITYSIPEKGIEYLVIPDEGYNVTVLIDYNSSILVNQYASLESIDNYKTEIATARTFVFLHELEVLASKGLIKGGDLDNALVIVDKELPKKELDHLADLFKKPHLDIEPHLGILNNTELRHPNEPARHKLLDLIGDLSLLGLPIKGKIVATRPGHKTNIEMARLIQQQIKKEKIKNSIPTYDIYAKPLLDINDIRKLLPHRYPFLLIDKILLMDETSVVGLKNVTYDENFFVGHFPNDPVMPGVLQIEAMAQTGGIMVLKSVPDPHNYTTLFMKIDNVRFRNKVVPGDTLIFRLELLSPIRRGLCNMKGVAYVGSKIVMEAEMLAQITKVSDNPNKN
jgi:UDP-3-O-[3-hydroxymyristoyl] N-acetylglucosamine deacetylase / 3-hydroxyacyl-[acyl-carrier-protein] dehydratase